MNNKRWQIFTVLAFPVVLAAGIVLIPVVADYSDHQLAEQAVGQTARWFSGHLIAAIGFSLSVLAVVSVNRHLRLSSRSLPAVTLPCIALGAGLYAAGLGADGIGPVAVQSAGDSPSVFFDGSGMWVTGVFIASTIMFGIGLLSLVIGAIRAGLLKGWSRHIAFVAALVFMVAPAIPLGWARCTGWRWQCSAYSCPLLSQFAGIRRVDQAKRIHHASHDGDRGGSVRLKRT